MIFLVCQCSLFVCSFQLQRYEINPNPASFFATLFLLLTFFLYNLPVAYCVSLEGRSLCLFLLWAGLRSKSSRDGWYSCFFLRPNWSQKHRFQEKMGQKKHNFQPQGNSIFSLKMAIFDVNLAILALKTSIFGLKMAVFDVNLAILAKFRWLFLGVFRL